MIEYVGKLPAMYRIGASPPLFDTIDDILFRTLNVVHLVLVRLPCWLFLRCSRNQRYTHTDMAI